MSTLRIHACTVKNYRGLREARLEFDSLTVLIGENDCGRSSLLNALEACLGCRSHNGTIALTARDFHREGPGHPLETPISIEIEIREDEPPGRDAPWQGLRRAGLAHPNGRLEFVLGVEAEPDREGEPETQFWLEGPRPFTGDPHRCLEAVRAAVPFLRVRAAVLRPAPWPTGPSADPEAAARQQVDWEIRQAFEEVLEMPGDVSERTLAKVRAMIRSAVGPIGARTREDEWRGPDADRVLAPLSVSSSWSRVASLLAGKGARSVATLAFLEALLNSRGPEGLHPEANPVLSLEDPEAYLHPMMLATVWSIIQRLPAQKIVSSNSADLLQAVPLGALRRIVRDGHGQVDVYQVPPTALSQDEMRRIAYHLRVLRGATLFMRFWLLVEGETEYWLLPEAARAMGIDLVQEGVGCIGFAQCGVAPVARLANHLGIGWHLLADGDPAGQHYAEQARAVCERGAVTVLNEPDLEHCMWAHGYDRVFRKAAALPPDQELKPSETIERAIRKQSKPRLALHLGEAMMGRGPRGVPPAIRTLLLDAVARARQGQDS